MVGGAVSGMAGNDILGGLEFLRLVGFFCEAIGRGVH
jgi:hypothetical protein